MFRKADIDQKAPSPLVELLTIDIYNLRLDIFASAKYYDFLGVVNRGMTVSREVLHALQNLLHKDVWERNLSVPLTSVTTSADQQNILDSVGKAYEVKEQTELGCTQGVQFRSERGP